MHISKIKLAGSNYKNLCDHMERKHLYYKTDVDLNESYRNIVIKPFIRDLKSFITSQGVKRTRKDSVGAIGCVCTVAKDDKAFLEEHPEEYVKWGNAVIEATLKSLNLTEKDLLGAVIHRDEGPQVDGGNAHLQFFLAPIVREKDKVRLSAKEVTTKAALNILHDNLQVFMENEGFKGQYVSQSKEDRGLSPQNLEEFKRSKEVINKLTTEKKQLTSEIKALKQSRSDLQRNKGFLLDEIKSLKDESNALNQMYLDYRDLADLQGNFILKQGLSDEFEKWSNKQKNKAQDLGFFDRL